MQVAGLRRDARADKDADWKRYHSAIRMSLELLKLDQAPGSGATARRRCAWVCAADVRRDSIDGQLMTRRTQAPPPQPAQHFNLSPNNLRRCARRRTFASAVVAMAAASRTPLDCCRCSQSTLASTVAGPSCLPRVTQSLEQADGMVDESQKLYGSLHPDGLGGYKQTPRSGGRSRPARPLIYRSWASLGNGMACRRRSSALTKVEQVTEDQFESVAGRNRTMAGVRPRVIATANPPLEGKEHWLTRMLEAGGWIDKDGWAVPRWTGRSAGLSAQPASTCLAMTRPSSAALPQGYDGQPVPPRSLTFVQMLIKDHPDPEFRRQYERTMSGYSGSSSCAAGMATGMRPRRRGSISRKSSLASDRVRASCRRSQ